MRLHWIVVTTACVLATACATTQEKGPAERAYLDPGYRIFELVQRAIENIGGEVVAAVRQAGLVTGRIPDEIGGAVIFIDVSIDRSRGPGDESWVRASLRSESAAMPSEDLQSWRERFFEELDALAAELLRR